MKLGYRNNKESGSISERYGRARVHSETRKRLAPESDHDEDRDDPGPGSDPEDCFYGIPVQTDVTSHHIGLLESDIEMLKGDCESLKLYLEEERVRMNTDLQKQVGELKHKVLE